MEALQIYWWFVISLLGGLLVFLLFVQGGQTLLWGMMTPERRHLAVNALGRKWELTYTTLVVFGGAYFASFPLYYSTSFGGAYWLWMFILVSFILQAVSYSFRSKPGNLFGTTIYDCFLAFNGCVGCVLLGCAVGMQYFGADFEVSRQNILDGASPVISQWNSFHGLEQIFSLRNLCLGFAIFFLARTLAVLFFRISIKASADDDERLSRTIRARMLVNGTVFLGLFLFFLFALFQADGYQANAAGKITAVPNLYFWNLVDLWWIGAAFLLGVVMVLWGIVAPLLSNKSLRSAFWLAGIGTVITVTSLLCVSGYNGTSFLPSVSHPQSSLTLANASSSSFTLTVMAWVTLLLPVVIAYIAWAWWKLTTPAITSDELSSGDVHAY